jgi:hypothetical protein
MIKREFLILRKIKGADDRRMFLHKFNAWDKGAV